MSVVVAKIRDAVVAGINSAGLTPAITALAIYDVVSGLQTLAGGRIVVCPKSKSPSLLTRGASQQQKVEIDVAVQYKYKQPTPFEIDPYLAIAEAIPDLFLGKKLSTFGSCIESSFQSELFLPAHIEQFRTFTSVITLGFWAH